MGKKRKNSRPSVPMIRDLRAKEQNGAAPTPAAPQAPDGVSGNWN
jgi:hypothetical protein